MQGGVRKTLTPEGFREVNASRSITAVASKMLTPTVVKLSSNAS